MIHFLKYKFNWWTQKLSIDKKWKKIEELRKKLLECEYRSKESELNHLLITEQLERLGYEGTKQETLDFGLVGRREN